MAMRKIVVSQIISLDGVFEHPEFSQPYRRAEQMALKLEELREADALLLGRITYEDFAAAWPQMGGGEYAERMNSYPKYVASKSLTVTTWNASVLQGDLPAAIGALKEQPGRDLLIYGSGTLVASLARHDLVDEYHLMLCPLTVGTGRRLFPEGVGATFQLVGSRAFDSGVVFLTYRRAPQAAAAE